MAEWLPIKDAPTDGTYVDVWIGGEFPHRRRDAFFGQPHHQCGEAGQYCDSCPPDIDVWCDDMGPLEETPTHFMLFPLPPVNRRTTGDVMAEWQPIESAPQDNTLILGWCNHEADPYQDPENPNWITVYAAHCDGLSHVENGPHVLVWGGAVDDHPDDGGAQIPDWWFLNGSEFEVVANPTHWMPIPAQPT